MRVVVPFVMLALVTCGGGQHATTPRATTVPPLFASIPADTAYVVASLDPFPLEVLAMFRDTFGGAMRDQLLEEDSSDPDDREATRLWRTVLAELEGKWNAAGFESLGFSPTPHWAIYGLPLWPVVRIEVRDGRRVLDSIRRIAARAGFRLPSPEVQDGATLWRIADGTDTIVIAITPDQLVGAYGPTSVITRAMPLILGSQKPEHGMGDAAPLASLRDHDHLGGNLIGYVDTRQLATHWLQPRSPGCRSEIDRFAARVPRMTTGNTVGLSGSEGTFVVELAPDLIAALRGLRVALPGVAEAGAGAPVLMFAGGVDLPRGQPLAVAAAEAIGRLAAVCGRSDEVAATAARGLSEPIGPPWSELRGGVLRLDKIGFQSGALPTDIDGFFFITSPSAAAIFERIGGLLGLPPGTSLDGALHPNQPERTLLPLAVPLFIGGRAPTIAFATGGGRARAERALATAVAPVPFLTFDVDYRKLLALRARLGDGDRAVDQARAKLYQRLRGTLDVTRRGLEFHFHQSYAPLAK